MKRSLAVAVALVGISASGLAQQNSTLKVKPSGPGKAPKQSAPIVKSAPATSSAANAKELQNIERQSVKGSATPRAAGNKTPGKAPALKPAKDKPNPPINFGGTSGGKGSGMGHQGSSAYKGRLKQKGAGQHQ